MDQENTSKKRPKKDEAPSSAVSFIFCISTIAVLGLVVFVGFSQMRLDLRRELFDAIGNHDITRMQMAINWGADVNAVNWRGNTPLIHAIRPDMGLDAIRLLLGSGADINATGSAGLTALMHAAHNSISPSTVLFLLDNGADVSIKCNAGRNALYYLERNEFLSRLPQIVVIRERMISQIEE